MGLLSVQLQLKSDMGLKGKGKGHSRIGHEGPEGE